MNKLNKTSKDKNENKYSVITSNKIQLDSENKIENKFKNLNIEKNSGNDIIIKNENLKKYKFEIRQNLIEQFTFKGNKNDEKRIFTNLDIKKCEGQEIKAIKKVPKNLEKISNGELIIKQKEKETKEIETQIEPELINSNLILDKNIKYRINQIKKEENIIVKNKSINIRHKNKKSNLIIVKQKKMNLLPNTKKIFKKENIEPCYSETITIKTRESYEDPIPNYRLAKKFTKLLISDNENLIPKNNINLISNTLSQINENQFELIGKKNESVQDNKEIEEKEFIQKPIIDIKINNNQDIEKNMTKQFINNMVQNKLEIEKKKNMDNTKNKLVIIFKGMKMKNALSKNIKNKKYFFDRLKKIKEAKLNSLICSKAFNYNYLPIDKEKTEEYTDTIDLKNNNFAQLYTENNTIQIKHKKKAKNLLSKIKENDINIEGIKNISSINLIQKIDKEIQMSPKKEFVIKNKITEIDSKPTKIDVTTQTPRLRPRKKYPMKIVLNEISYMVNNDKSFSAYKIDNNYEINHTLDISYKGKTEIMNDTNNSIKNENEDIKDRDKIFRISQFNKIFKAYFNKKISFLQLLYFTKWVHLTKNHEISKSKNRAKNIKIMDLFCQNKAIIAHRLLDFAKKYKTEKGLNLMVNMFNRRTMKLLKGGKEKKIDVNILRKYKNASYIVKKFLRKQYGKYVLGLYKKK